MFPPPMEDYYRMAPAIVLCVTAMLVTFFEAFMGRQRKWLLGVLAFVGTGAAMAILPTAARHAGPAFGGLVALDGFSLFLHIVVLLATLLVILASVDYLDRENLQRGEFYALLLLAATGMLVMASAQELITAFIGLEISSMASYILASFRRDSLRGNESAMKYFLLGSFATAFFLYGIAMVYGATGKTTLAALQQATNESPGVLTILGLGLMFVGLGFKVASAPFQVWTPDVYEGAPTPVTAMLASGPKAAAFALLLRILLTGYGATSELWLQVVWISAALTMTVGNFGALVQSNVKRMLAYSSIAHAGYILVALASRDRAGVEAILYYLVAYSLMTIGAFTIVAHLSGPGERRLMTNDFAGLGTRQPVTAAFFTLFLLSLLGLPTTAGFLGKLYVFQAALDSQLTWLVIVAAVNTVVGAYYYLRVIVVMYMREPEADWKPAPVPAAVMLVLLVTAAGTIYLGLFPNRLMELAKQSATSLW